MYGMGGATRNDKFIKPWDTSIMLPGDPNSYGGLKHPFFSVKGKLMEESGFP